MQHCSYLECPLIFDIQCFLYVLHIDYGHIIPPNLDGNDVIVEFAFTEKDGFYQLEKINDESNLHNKSERFMLLPSEHSLATFLLLQTNLDTAFSCLQTIIESLGIFTQLFKVVLLLEKPRIFGWLNYISFTLQMGRKSFEQRLLRNIRVCLQKVYLS